MGSAGIDLRDFEALTFDCYGTLIDWERGLLDSLSTWVERTGIEVDGEGLLEMFAEFEPRRQAAGPQTAYPEILRGALGDMASRLGADVTDEELTAFGQSVRTWPAFADSGEALCKLKERYKLVIVSNVDRESFRYSNEKLGVEFDSIVTAEDAGSYKPAPGHFREALRRLEGEGIEKGRVLHVAQSIYHDHVPAKAMGLSTAWVNRRGGKSGTGATKRAAVEVHPDLIVGNLEELARLAATG